MKGPRWVAGMMKRRVTALIGTLLLLVSFNAPRQVLANPMNASIVQEGAESAEINAGTLRFEHLEVVEGLSENTILAIFQDHQGFLWFGAREGLNRSDGYDFTVYKADPNDPDSLTDSWITDIVETSDGVLWAGTRNGLIQLNPDGSGYTTFTHSTETPKVITALEKGWHGIFNAKAMVPDAIQD